MSSQLGEPQQAASPNERASGAAPWERLGLGDQTAARKLNRKPRRPS